jgi:hypothetical protein
MISENQKMLGHLMTYYIFDIVKEDDEQSIWNVSRHPKNINIIGLCNFYSISRKQINTSQNIQYQLDTLEKYIYYLEDKIETLNKKEQEKPQPQPQPRPKILNNKEKHEKEEKMKNILTD